MKSKKYFGPAVMIFCLCALLVFTFGFLPSVLATPPENCGIETITVESLPPEETFEHTNDAAQTGPGEFGETTPIPEFTGGQPTNMPWDSGEIEPIYEGYDDIGRESPTSTPNINAITRDQAIEIAQNVIKYDEVPYTYAGELGEPWPQGDYMTIQTDFRDARYVDSADPIGDPSWFVVFSAATVIERCVGIPDDYTPQEFLAANNKEDFFADEGYYRKSWIGVIEEDDDRPVFVMETAWVRYIVAEINALTGEFIERGVLDTTGLDLPFEAFYGDIRENFIPWPLD